MKLCMPVPLSQYDPVVIHVQSIHKEWPKLSYSVVFGSLGRTWLAYVWPCGFTGHAGSTGSWRVEVHMQTGSTYSNAKHLFWISQAASLSSSLPLFPRIRLGKQMRLNGSTWKLKALNAKCRLSYFHSELCISGPGRYFKISLWKCISEAFDAVWRVIRNLVILQGKVYS